MTLLEAAKYFKDRYGIQDEAEEMIKDFEKLMEGHYQVDIPEERGSPPGTGKISRRDRFLCT